LRALTALLTDWLQVLRDPHADSTASLPLTLGQLTNWFTPRQAVNLKQRLLTGTDLLSDADVQSLGRLGDTYWQANPPMFWFNAGTVASLTSAGKKGFHDQGMVNSQVMHDVGELLGLLKMMGFGVDDIVFWRYAKADARTHRRFWKKLVTSQGFKFRIELRSGRATTASCIGVSLCDQRVKRSDLLAVWLVGLTRIVVDRESAVGQKD